MSNIVFEPCEICSGNEWSVVYRGSIRDGSYGNHADGAEIARCGGCGVERLAEIYCTPDTAYETDEYRALLQQGLDSESYFAIHDELQIFALNTLWPRSFRGRTIADVGCAGGSFLDNIKGSAKNTIGIEPYGVYRNSLQKRGYEVFPYSEDAAISYGGCVDLATSFQVIEHTSNPVEFLTGIRALLKDDGVLLLSTPNRGDILMDLHPDGFSRFFYRVVHRWYFTMESLVECARHAGFEPVEQKYVHRYGMSNTLAWLRDNKPTGRQRLPGIDSLADDLWKSYLESSGRSDTIFLLLKSA